MIFFPRLNSHEIFFYLLLKEVSKMNIIGKPVEILLVEDNKGDVGLIEEVFEEAKIRNNLHIAEDGEEAMLHLHGEGKFSGSPRPDIILLDLNLPKKDGREVLREIKEDSNLTKHTRSRFNYFQR